MFHNNQRFGQKPLHKINGRIGGSTVRVLDEEGNQLGVMPTQAALRKAQTLGVDLIEIAPQAQPPVCQLCDYGKFLYKINKSKDPVANHKVKEIQLSASIAENDRNIKLRHALEFLSGGHSVRLSMMLRGREKAHPEIGKAVFTRFLAALTHQGYSSQKISQNNGQFFCHIPCRKSPPRNVETTKAMQHEAQPILAMA